MEKTADAQISIWIVYYIQCENARAERLAGGNSLSVKDEVEMGGADLSAVPVLSDAANEPKFEDWIASLAFAMTVSYIIS